MTIITNEMTPNERGQVTGEINEFLKAKSEEERIAGELVKATAKRKAAQAKVLSAMGGQVSIIWQGSVNSFNLLATYGKTRKTLSQELIEKELKVKVTDACFTISKPWDELRIKVCG